MPKLDKNLLDLLKEFTPSVIATVSPENKPYTTFITWLIAKDEETIRVAVSTNSTTVNNIRENPNVCIEVFGPDIAASISGTASILKENIEGISFPVSVVEIKIDNITNNLFPGATVTGEIPFKHTGNIQKALELDEKVLKALRE